jgi:hypothetical protein
MNHYPTIYHPITKEPINLFSDEINELLEKGYDENILLSQKRVIYSTPFHHVPDVDYEKMMQMNFKQLKLLCSTNKYGYQLCQNKNFWINKFNYDDLYTPSEDLLTTNWLKSYYMLNWITNYMRESSVDNKSLAIINDKVIKLVKKYYDTLDPVVEPNLGAIVFYYEKRLNKYIVHFKGIQNNHYYSLDSIRVDKNILVDFLYEGLMSGGITELIEK